MAAQIHLALNHFPFVGLLFGTILLLLSWVRAFSELRKSALILFVLSGLIALPTYFSGEGAEEVLRSSADFSKTLIHNHEEWAEVGFIATLVLAALAIFLLWLERIREIAKIWYALFFIGALLVSVLLGRVNHLGGLISHPELRGQSMP